LSSQSNAPGGGEPQPDAEQSPPFDYLQARLLPAADAFMAVMLSRPASGSLRTTRVTLVTIVLATAVALFVGVPAVVLVLYSLFWLKLLLLVPAVLGLLLGLGAASVAVYGVRQRTLRRRSPG
jgi:hypothetical protein